MTREPSYICSVLDDCAAAGDTERLERLFERLRRMADKWPDARPRKIACSLSWAVVERIHAIKARLAGNINSAMYYENRSEGYLSNP